MYMIQLAKQVIKRTIVRQWYNPAKPRTERIQIPLSEEAYSYNSIINAHYPETPPRNSGCKRPIAGSWGASELAASITAISIVDHARSMIISLGGSEG